MFGPGTRGWRRRTDKSELLRQIRAGGGAVDRDALLGPAAEQRVDGLAWAAQGAEQDTG